MEHLRRLHPSWRFHLNTKIAISAARVTGTFESDGRKSWRLLKGKAIDHRPAEIHIQPHGSHGLGWLGA
jgi:hypothetical protein